MAIPDSSNKPEPASNKEAGQGSANKEDAGNTVLWRFFGMGLQLAFTVALFAALGWWLDNKFGWTPWGLLGFSTFGVVVGMYQFLKASL